MSWRQIAIVFTLAGAAVLGAGGCLFAPGPFGGFDILVCQGGKYQTYTFNPFYVGPIGDPINGKPCDGSNDDPAHKSNQSEAVTTSSSTGPSSGANRPRAASDARTAHQDWFGLLSLIPGVPSFPNASVPHECTPGTSLYVVNHTSSTVTRMDTCPLAVGKVIDVSSNPLQLELTPDGGTLVVTRYDSRVVLIDTATDTVTATISTPGLYPSGIAISPDGNTAYITNFNNASAQVFELDLATRQIGRSVTTPYAFPKSLALTPDGQQLWVNYWQSSTVSIIDTLTMTTTSQVDAGGEADTGMAFNPTGTRAYIAARPNMLAVFDTATLKRIAQVPTGQWPTDVVFTPDGSRVLVRSLLEPVISVIDPRTNETIETAQIGSAGGMGLTIFQ